MTDKMCLCILIIQLPHTIGPLMCLCTGDLCWIPQVCVLAIVEPPVPMSVVAHHYKLSTEIFSKIDGILCMMQIKSNSL